MRPSPPRITCSVKGTCPALSRSIVADRAVDDVRAVAAHRAGRTLGTEPVEDEVLAPRCFEAEYQRAMRVDLERLGRVQEEPVLTPSGRMHGEVVVGGRVPK